MESMQQAIAVLFVLGLLGGALCWLRSRGVAQFGLKLPMTGGRQKSMRVIERLSLTPQHTVHLVEMSGRTVLIATSPAGCTLLDRPAGDLSEGRVSR